VETSDTTARLGTAIRFNRVFVIDDDVDIHEVLRTVLETAGFRVDTFSSAILFLSSGAAALAGCVLTDFQMPGMNGLELQKELSKRGAHMAVVVMAGNGIVKIAVRAMKAGAIDFLEKPFSEAALLESVGRALDFVSNAEMSSSLISTARERIALLTKREREVFDLVVAGDSNRAVARKLRISPRTVELHRAHVAKKMGTRNLAQLVCLAITGARSSSGMTKPREPRASAINIDVDGGSSTKRESRSPVDCPRTGAGGRT
jgi:two-component system, LuxR family, response regulator FixJ